MTLRPMSSVNPFGGPDIFTYLDYRAFLKDAFQSLKDTTPRLSFRSFAKKAGFTSPNFLQQVINGKRNLGPANTLTVARAFRLDRQETAFLRCLVDYGQARNPEERDLFFRQIHGNRRYGEVKTLEKHQYDYFTHWYNPVVRELLTHKDFNGDCAWIAERIFPRIAIAQVEASKRLLEELALIHWDGRARRWRQSDAVVASQSEVGHLAARNYHRSAIQLAHDAIKHFAPSERDIRSVTLGLTKTGFADLKSLMETYWRKILDLAGSFPEADKVYQINLQLFPLVKGRKQ